MCFRSYTNRKIKSKTVISWSSRKKKEVIFSTIYFVRKKFLNICVLFHCIECWIHFQNIHTFTYQKSLLHTIFCLFLKSSKAFSLKSYSPLYVTLAYSQPFHILSPGIFRTGGIFKTLWNFDEAYSELCHSQNSLFKRYSAILILIQNLV